MELPKDETIQKYGRKKGHYNRNTLLPYENEFNCISSGLNLIKRNYELSKIQRKRNRVNFINRLKYEEHKKFCICAEVYKFYEGDDYDRIYEVLSTSKNKQIKKIINFSIEKIKDMLENPNFEQDCYSRTAIGI